MPNVNDKKQKRSLLSRVSAMSLPSDALLGEVRLEMRGRGTLMLTGCRRIIKYTPQEIIIGTKDFFIVAAGSELICTTYHYGSVTVEGHICSISFEEGEE